MNTLAEFALDLTFDDLPDPVVAFTQRCLLDVLGVAASGTTTDLSILIRQHAVEQFASGGRPARLLFDGRPVSAAGATLAGGMTIDAIDAHDGHKLTKGHVGCGVVPAVLALGQAETIMESRELLPMVAVGYEIGTRAGIAMHQTVPDYHSSGASISLATAALGARALGLDGRGLAEALGIAEYHGPRSQMMRVIDHPTMVKDGSGWGAMAGISAAYLAANGFTGAPAITVKSPEVNDLWQDLGSNWRIFEQYFKPHPVCRWAQPAVEAALALRQKHGLDGSEISEIKITTFHEAFRLATVAPTCTEQAQYSLPFSVGAALAHGQLGVQEITKSGLTDQESLRLAAAITIVESPGFNAAFPAQRFAQVSLICQDGTTFVSPVTEPRGDPENHLSSAEINEKFHRLADPILGTHRAHALRSQVAALSDGGETTTLLSLLTEPVA